ncbi:hypothetical protein KC347_g1418 [Hortaea werneckii]|nr:hypothetical protein KC347_g1418 [Hortaea werneckii]
MFECSADELKVEQSADPTDQLTAADEQARNPFREDTRAELDHDSCASRGLHTSEPAEQTAVVSNNPSKRRVSFSDRDRFINAQLSSIKAPPRPQATSDDDDAEDSEDEDDEYEPATSEDEQQGALQNVDAAKGIDDELLVDYANDSLIPQRSTPIEEPTLHPTSPYIGREDAVYSSEDESPEERIETPRFFQRRSIERMRLMETDESIDEFPDKEHAERMSAAVPSHYSGSREGRMSRQARRPRLRSILKSNTPLIPEITYRPNDLEGNTRRNSRHAVNVEDSRYFSQASEILRDPGESNHKILPRRKRSIYFGGEYEKQVEGHHDEPLHGSRQDAGGLRDSQSSPRPETNLKTLTRQVSMANGTMSQSVRRRSTLGFDSPFKIPPIR